jgi:Ca2+-dependent lipid-binding protein
MSHATDRVQITLHAQKLKNVAGTFKGTSDPYAVVTQIASEPGQQPIVLGKTEVIKNNLSPHWVTTFTIDYEFSTPTRINVGVYDQIIKSKNNKPMGSAIFEVGEVLGSRGNIKAKKIKGGGTLFCRIQKAPEVSAGTFHFQLRGVKLKNVGT